MTSAQFSDKLQYNARGRKSSKTKDISVKLQKKNSIFFWIAYIQYAL